MTVRESLDRMTTDARRHARRTALQWLYRFDAAGTDDINPEEELPIEQDEESAFAIARARRGGVVAAPESVDDDADEPVEIVGHARLNPTRIGFDLATLAWAHRDEADAAVKPLVPDWPTHRQPVIDRSLFRLAWYEVVHGQLAARSAIVESVELAREFSTERSPSFINGVLDALFRDRLGSTGSTSQFSSDGPDGERGPDGPEGEGD